MDGDVSTSLKTSFDVTHSLGPFFSQGKVQISSDSSTLFSQHGSKIHVVGSTAGSTMHTLDEEDELSCFCVSSDSKFVVTAHRRLMVHFWDWKTKSKVHSWKAVHRHPITVMAIDPSSTLVASGSTDASVKVYDIYQKFYTHNLVGSQGVVSLAEFYQFSKRLLLLTSSGDHAIRVWDLKCSKCIAVMEGHFSTVTSFAFLPKDNILFSSGRDKVINIWNLENFSLLQTVPAFESLESVVVLPKSESPFLSGLNCETASSFIATAGEQAILKVWRYPSVKCVAEKRLSQMESRSSPSASDSHLITQLLVCRDAERLAVVSYNSSIVFLDLRTMDVHQQLVGHLGEVLEAKFFGEGDLIAVATSNEFLKVVEFPSMNTRIFSGHSGTITCLDVSSDWRMVVTSSKDGSVKLWILEGCSITCISTGTGHTHSVSCVAFSRSNNDFLVSCSLDFTIKLWDLKAALKKKSPQLTVKWTEKAHDKDVNAVAVSPNDKLIATASLDKTVKVWTPAGQCVATLSGHTRGLWCLQFSPVDKLLATGAADGLIRLWSLSHYACVKVLEGHGNSVLKICFTSKGQQILSSASDGLIKLWNVKDNECVKTFDHHSGKVWALACNNHDDLMVSGDSEAELFIWKDTTEEQKRKEEESAADLVLKEQELSNLLHERQYTRAVSLAITLDQPFRLYKIFKDIVHGENGQQMLASYLTDLNENQLATLLGYVSDWNTNSKHYHIAQLVLNIFLRTKTPESLLQYDNVRRNLEGIIPYTERHLKRVEKAEQMATFLDYMWISAKLPSMDVDT